MRKKIVRVAAGVAMLLMLAGCGTTITIGHSASGQAGSNTGIQLVNGTAAAHGAPALVASTTVGQQQTAPAYVQLSAKSSALGTLVTDSNGRTLYRFDKDSPKPSTTTCTGACQTTWPPVIVAPKGKVYADGVPASGVGTVTRPDGSLQITLGGWPVYEFSGDHAAGDTNGQGVNGTWFAVAPDGSKASTAVAGASTPSQPGTSANAVLTSQQSTQGLVVANGNGMTVYVNSTDSSDPTSARCTDSCANGFVPVPAATGAVQIKGVTAADLGKVTRPDGTVQMTLVGFPLYTSSGDQKPGDTTGTATKGWFTISLDGDHQS